MHAYRVGRVRLIFQLPSSLVPSLADSTFAYVERFSPLGNVDPTNRMYLVHKVVDGRGIQSADIVPISQISRSCHLVPQLTDDLTTRLSPHSILDDFSTFYVNDFLDLHSYLIL